MTSFSFIVVYACHSVPLLTIFFSLPPKDLICYIGILFHCVYKVTFIFSFTYTFILAVIVTFLDNIYLGLWLWYQITAQFNNCSFVTIFAFFLFFFFLKSNLKLFHDTKLFEANKIHSKSVLSFSPYQLNRYWEVILEVWKESNYQKCVSEKITMGSFACIVVGECSALVQLQKW